MKRKKWSEVEEKSLLSKYADLLNSGTLSKLKTREKKFKPVADYVNHLHHHQDPNAFPFKWSWRDVSIKVQNMRHQYLGVKQKIRLSDDRFNWADGDNHWDNFIKYKEVFGDVDLQVKDNNKLLCGASSSGDDTARLDDDDDPDNDDILGADDGIKFHRTRKKLGLLGGRVLELRCGIAKMEDKKRQREVGAEKASLEMRQNELGMDELQEQWEQEAEIREMQLEKSEMEREKRQLQRWMRMDKELDRERQWRMKMEDKKEEEEMEWRERMLSLQMEHEKSMMQMYSDACLNQMQILGRLLCHLFGSGLGAQALQNMPGGMDDDAKADANSQSQFL